MFKDLLVIDASTVLAGPSVSSFFAELGSRVIKIEHPKHMDVTRTWKLPSEDKDSGISAYFSSVNYLKEYEYLDFQNEKDKSIFNDLISKADILITNFKKGDAEKFSITDDQLHALNPRLIIGKINGYGSDSDRVAYDLILQAETGFMSMNGTLESGPIKMPVAMIDILAAHHLKEAILIKLIERVETGIGRSVSVSLYDAAVSSLTNQASNYLMTGEIPQRIGSLHPNIAPYGEIFETADEGMITFAIGSDHHFEGLCSYLSLNHLAESFSSNQMRVKNRTLIHNELQKKIKERNSKEILDDMFQLKIPAGKINNLAEVFRNDQAKSLIREEKIDNVITKRIASKIYK